jgi:hypothetical protein
MRAREIPRTWPLSQALFIAQGILSGDVGIIEGCIRLYSFSNDIVPDWRVDPDFVIFGAVASETDHLPFGEVRSHWSAAALVKADSEIAKITENVGSKVRIACEHVVARFTGVESFP